MISFGADELIFRNPPWKTKNLGLVTNHAATTAEGRPVRQVLIEKGFNITRLFAPEHGLHTSGADGAFMENEVDELTGLEVISLYGNKLGPDQEDLADIDIVLFDIPDIGTRFYTYLWTMTHLLESCAKYNKPLIILDRPNPLSGQFELAEGPGLDQNRCSSFIGRWNIPLRHSCTLGELASYFNEKKAVNADLEIIKCGGWDRKMFHVNWNIPFVPTSPAIRNFTTTLIYPGTGLLEATNISEGRGTPSPFVRLGAPWIDPDLLLMKVDGVLKGLSIRKTEFVPSEGKFEGLICYGLELLPENPEHIKSVFNGLVLIKAIKDLFPAYFNWKPYPTHANPGGKSHLDKLLGIYKSESLFELGFEEFLIKAVKITGTGNWKREIERHLLY